MSYKPVIVKLGPDEPSLDISEWRSGVLLRSTNWLGDVLMTLPATWQLKKNLPGGVGVNVLAPAGLCGIWKAAPWIDRVFPMVGHRISSVEAAQIRKEKFGVGIVLPNSFGAAYDLYRCGIPCRYGRGGFFRRWLLTDCIRRWKRGEGNGKCHQLSFYLELIRRFGDVEYSAECPRLVVQENLASALGVVPRNGWMALCPGAAYGPAKQWPAENFIAVGKAWISKGGKVVLLGAKKDVVLCEQIAAGIDGQTLQLAGKTSLEELMAVLAACDKVVANDSGSMHLAAAVGTSGIALFASTDPIATGPLGAPWELLVADIACRPCLKRECPFGHYDCMKKLPAEKVVSLILNT